jgi:hypothetical protein
MVEIPPSTPVIGMHGVECHNESMFIITVQKIGPPLWSNGKSFWLLTQRSRGSILGSLRLSE